MKDNQLFKQFLEIDIKEENKNNFNILELSKRLTNTKSFLLEDWNNNDYSGINSELNLILNYCIQGYSHLTFKNIEQIKKEMLHTFENKNHDYGNSVFDVARDFEPYGAMTFLIRISDKINRIQVLATKEINKVEESIEDTLIDCANYIILYRIYMYKKTQF